MILAILSAVACLAATTIMFGPRMRSFAFYRPVALFFLFEGIWILTDYAFDQMIPDNVFMDIIHYCGLIAIALYFILSIMLNPDRSKKRK